MFRIHIALYVDEIRQYVKRAMCLTKEQMDDSVLRLFI